MAQHMAPPVQPVQPVQVGRVTTAGASAPNKPKLRWGRRKRPAAAPITPNQNDALAEAERKAKKAKKKAKAEKAARKVAEANAAAEADARTLIEEDARRIIDEANTLIEAEKAAKKKAKAKVKKAKAKAKAAKKEAAGNPDLLPSPTGMSSEDVMKGAFEAAVGAMTGVVTTGARHFTTEVETLAKKRADEDLLPLRLVFRGADGRYFTTDRDAVRKGGADPMGNNKVFAEVKLRKGRPVVKGGIVTVKRELDYTVDEDRDLIRRLIKKGIQSNW